MSLGADYLATGHYCQTDGKNLLRGRDLNKDQSYFLHKIDGSVLPKVLFPIGHLEKTKVRHIAKETRSPSLLINAIAPGFVLLASALLKALYKPILKQIQVRFWMRGASKLACMMERSFIQLANARGLGSQDLENLILSPKKDMSENTITLVQGQDHPWLYSKELYVKKFNMDYRAEVYKIPSLLHS